MDTQTPLTPDLDGFRAKVLTVKPRTYVCCICHGNRITNERRNGVCGNPLCVLEAQRLGWWRL